MISQVLDLQHELLMGGKITARPEFSRKQLREVKRLLWARRFSASLVVDIGNTTQYDVSLNAVPPASGVVTVGTIVDLINANTMCNVFVNVGGFLSGPLGIQVQTSDGPFSGSFLSGGGGPQSGTFTDPTSGLAAFPTNFSSGGILWLNSGLYNLPGGGGISGGSSGSLGLFPFGLDPVINGMGGNGPYPFSGNFPIFCSGGVGFGAFQRPGRYARLLVVSGTTPPGTGGASGTAGAVIAGFISQLKQTGSGGGFSFSPSSGAVNV